MEDIFADGWIWFYVAIVVGIVALAISHWVTTSNKTRRHVADAANGGDYRRLAEDSAAVHRAVLERLDALETRVAGIEKTLADIPA